MHNILVYVLLFQCFSLVLCNEANGKANKTVNVYVIFHEHYHGRIYYQWWDTLTKFLIDNFDVGQLKSHMQIHVCKGLQDHVGIHVVPIDFTCSGGKDGVFLNWDELEQRQTEKIHISVPFNEDQSPFIQTHVINIVMVIKLDLYYEHVESYVALTKYFNIKKFYMFMIDEVHVEHNFPPQRLLEDVGGIFFYLHEGKPKYEKKFFSQLCDYISTNLDCEVAPQHEQKCLKNMSTVGVLPCSGIIVPCNESQCDNNFDDTDYDEDGSNDGLDSAEYDYKDEINDKDEEYLKNDTTIAYNDYSDYESGEWDHIDDK